VLLAALLAGCAADVHRVVAPGMTSAEVSARAGAPTIVGRLPNGEAYWDYSRQPYYTDRVSYGPDERVREVRNLLTEENFRTLRPGMSAEEVLATLGPSYVNNSFANGTTAWTYRFQDVGIWKLLHVLFDPSGRLQRYGVEWDPNIYSKKNGGRR
jgi:outer membrane protein assembly factor BamE (lipoprotein component of BamABCDE complex)